MKHPKDMHVISVIDTVDNDDLVVLKKERLIVDAPTSIIMNFYNNGME